MPYFTDDVQCDLCQVLFHVHCRLSISLRPYFLQQLVTALIEGWNKSLQVATAKLLKSIGNSGLSAYLLLKEGSYIFLLGFQVS